MQTITTRNMLGISVFDNVYCKKANLKVDATNVFYVVSKPWHSSPKNIKAHSDTRSIFKIHTKINGINYFPIQKVTCIDYQLVMYIGQQIGNKICKIGGK